MSEECKIDVTSTDKEDARRHHNEEDVEDDDDYEDSSDDNVSDSSDDTDVDIEDSDDENNVIFVENNDENNKEDNNDSVEKDIDYSDDDIDEDGFQTYSTNTPFKATKRAHHNALERKRRGNIKKCYARLNYTLPALRNRGSVSRSQTLEAAIAYLQTMPRPPRLMEQDREYIRTKNKECLSNIHKLHMIREALKRGNLCREDILKMGCPFKKDMNVDESDSESSHSDLNDVENEIPRDMDIEEI